MTIAQIKKNMKHGDYNILQKLLKLSTESAARQKFLRGDKDAVEGMIKIQENRSIFCDLHADEDCSCHDDLKEAINQKADINHTHDWNEITGKPTEFPPTHHSHDVSDIEGLDDVLHTIDDIRNLSNQKLDRDGSNATGSLASTINNNHNHVNKAVLDTITASKVNDWDNAAGKAHNAVALGSNATGLTITNQVLQFSNGYQLPTTIKVSEWDDAYLKRHIHGNKAVLDNLTQSVIDQSHTHSNKAVIDGITSQMINNWNASFANSHAHNNKTTLDGISSADVTNWDAAHANNHTHANKVILDAITAAYTVAEKNKLATIQPNAQVNVKADWNATSGDAEILNKPTSFTPASHNHAISDVAGLQSELDSKLEANDLDGFVHDVVYNSGLHTLTFYQRNEPNIVIDLPIEHLIKGVQLQGNDLVFTFEDGSNVTIPMNTLLVGVVKSVNGLVANSQGEVVLDINDIPGLQSVLNGKANTNGYYPNLNAGVWNGNSYNGSMVSPVIDYVMVYDIANQIWRPTNVSVFRDWLGITNINNNFIKGSNSVSIAQNFNFAIGYDGIDNFIQSHSNKTLNINPLGNNVSINNVTISGSNVYSGDITATSGNRTLTFDNLVNYGQPLRLNANASLGIILQSNGNNRLLINPNSVESLVLTYVPQLITNLSSLNTGIVPSDAGLKLWSGSGNAQYGIAVNSNAGGMDIMANQDGAGVIRFWSSTNNGTPTLSAVINGLYVGFNGTVSVETQINTANHGNSSQWYQAWLNSQTAINLTWNDVLLNGNIATEVPIFNNSTGRQMILKSPTSAGNNYISFENSSNTRTQYLGIGNSNNDHFQFYTGFDNFWDFYCNGSIITRHSSTELQVFKDLYVQSGSMIYTSNHGTSADWWDAKVHSFRHEYTGGINNGSANRTNQSFFDYNFMSTGRAGVVASFDGLNSDYRIELAGQYNGGGNDFYIRSMNGDIAQWNPARLLWHNGNFDPNEKANIYGSNLQNIPNWQSVLGITGLGTNKANVDGGNLTNIANWRTVLNIPTDNAQLTNGAGYITSASLPNVSNATITYQGTGAITGGGSHTINQSGNSAYNFDLTNQTKNEISLGVNAYNSLSSKQDTLVAGNGISIVGNTISATNSGGGSGIERIFTDNSSQSGPADEQSGVIFTSHEAYGLPQAEYKHEGNATIAIEDPKTLHLFSSYDSVHTIQTSGNNVHIDIDSIRAHIYNVVKFQAGSNHISVSFPNGIYAGDQINISAQRGTMIYINTPNLISSVGAEIPSHANLVWDPGLQAWVVKSFGY